MVIFHDSHRDENRAKKCIINLFVARIYYDKLICRLLLCTRYASPSFETTLMLLTVVSLCATYHYMVGGTGESADCDRFVSDIVVLLAWWILYHVIVSCKVLIVFIFLYRFMSQRPQTSLITVVPMPLTTLTTAIITPSVHMTTEPIVTNAMI